ncbi:MAG TPA: phosphopentomutase [Gammaproteobacteria bacterium]|nr:phosphopentomutase [Gammaproteobacteria bacterium]
MARAFILLLDSFGIGAADDAAAFGDTGANTFGHIAEKVSLNIPNLLRLGLGAAAEKSAKKSPGSLPGIPLSSQITAAYGFAAEKSSGKDTPSGHWEIAGVPVLFDWGYFPTTYPSFPEELTQNLITQANLPGILGNKHASGTDIIDELGEEHIKTGKPIIYTSADSVFQIAAHETYFGLEKLYDLCSIARDLVDPYNIGRVIARPFLGEPGKFYRTGNRRDIATPPPSATLLDNLVEQKRSVIAIGKVADIYAHRGISKLVKGDGNDKLFEALINETKSAPDNSLVFVNFVDFDMLYGHRRDVAGYAKALEKLDSQLPEFEKLLKPDDIAIITADHGCDPTFPGSDHTREHIPVLMFGPNVKPGFIGKRDTFADIGQTIAEHMGIKPILTGESFLSGALNKVSV